MLTMPGNRQYLTLVRSQVTYCSQVWRPYHVQDTKALERLQRRATKYVLNNYQLDYKSRLVSLNLLPLTLWMELQDILLFLELTKNPPDNFDVFKYVCFIKTSTRHSTECKIKTSLSVIPRLNSTRHHYFNRIIKISNSLPPLDLGGSMSTLKAFLVKLYIGTTLLNALSLIPLALGIMYALAIVVHLYLYQSLPIGRFHPEVKVT